jgi:hypothetical protein
MGHACETLLYLNRVRNVNSSLLQLRSIHPSLSPGHHFSHRSLTIDKDGAGIEHAPLPETKDMESLGSAKLLQESQRSHENGSTEARVQSSVRYTLQAAFPAS